MKYNSEILYLDKKNPKSNGGKGRFEAGTLDFYLQRMKFDRNWGFERMKWFG